MGEEKLRKLLEEATVDCYDEEEEFAGVLCTLEDRLHFPSQAEIMGARVEVMRLDSKQSGLRCSFVARVKVDDGEYTVSLADLDIVRADPESSKWLEMMRWWVTQ